MPTYQSTCNQSLRKSWLPGLWIKVECAWDNTQWLVSCYFFPLKLHPPLWTHLYLWHCSPLMCPRCCGWGRRLQLGTQYQGSWKLVDFSLVLKSRGSSSSSVVSDSLRPHEPHYTRPPCPSPTPGVYPNPCPLSRWCHPTISSSVVPFSSCPQPFPASRSFQMSQLFASGGQSTGVSASTSVPPMNTQDRSPLGWTSTIIVVH